ncbi:site-specific integrase [Shewanella algae]|uniref:tyrosine-type recombinase/integrase n=1 Tax=Shewanella algae TaxID=38313 RepID=UPI0031F59074
MNSKQISAFIKSGEITRKPVGDGLYIRVQTPGKASWEVRYTVNGKRKFITLAGGQYPQVTLADAKAEAAIIKANAKKGIDPKAERQKSNRVEIYTVDDLFGDWHAGLCKRLKHPNVPKRIYEKEVKPYIGQQPIDSVGARDIRDIIQKVEESGRPSTANDTLMYCKQMFNHACKLDLAKSNPASPFSVNDAGGLEKSRDRALSMDELSKLFPILRSYPAAFTRDNYLAIALLLVLGVRKNELTEAKWSELDLVSQLWHLPVERSKTGVAITIPLPTEILPWLEELKMRACGSEYLFPSRKTNAKRGHISPDTLNHALSKMFGKPVNGGKRHYPNVFAQADIDHFTIHDLRRTCRSLMSGLGIPGHVAERCLNHKLKGVEAIYNRYDYLDERREAHEKLANCLTPLVNNDSRLNN